MSDWRPRDPTGGESGASPAPPRRGPPFPPDKPRRHLDWRRIRATRFDGFLMVPPSIGILVLFHRHLVTAYFLILALNLVYHFVAETLFGQTIGKSRRNLRVVKRDGSPAGASA